ncbi:MAG: heavy metal translocating P-type ATPase [Candidatus Pacebacteria bacterium CG_4_10_14_0_8_um_filter_43_12]|nr:MAG: heavy metal translocating P-type ATPase [Candidatus Pacebacteria bacterium CG_4_10_14_0_8_um_filter_43_12]
MPNHNNTADQTFDVLGMHCASCASIVQRKLQKLAGVSACQVNYGTEKAKVAFDASKTSVEAMNHEIEKLGYSLVSHSVPITSTAALSSMADHQMAGHQMAGHDHQMITPLTTDAQVKAHKLQELAKLRQHVQIISPFVVISIIFMIWEFGSESLQFWPAIPMILETLFEFLLPLMATYSLFVIGAPYLQGLLRFIKYRAANMDTLVGMGTLIAFLYSAVLSIFAAPLSAYLDTSHQYYDVTIVVIGFITLGKFLEARSKLKTGEAIEKLVGLQAKTALVERNGKQIEVPIEQVIVGDVLIIKPGQKVPVDGQIIDGASAVDESMITGESLPVDKKAGDTVIGATINKQGVLRVTATKVGSETILAQIIKMVEEAQGSKAPIEKLADQISAVFVPVVLVLAVVTLVVWLAVGSQFLPLSQAVTLGITSFVSILVIACPCAMGLATPTAVIVGVGKAAQNGILIKNAENLERLSSVTTMIFDKTGTVTKGEPTVTDVVPVKQHSAEEVMGLLASLEQHSEHPLAQAVLLKAKAQKIKLQPVTDFSIIEGKGLQGDIATQTYWAGNPRLAKELKISIDQTAVKTLTTQGKTVVALMTNRELLGLVAIADTVKDEAKTVLKQLHAQGMKVVLLTGDNHATAEHIAKQVGIDEVIAEVLPGDKAQVVKKLQQQGQIVAMVGDGVNDAPALATADVGIAMGTGTDVAIESAGITLLGGKLTKLPKAIKLSRATMITIKQNLFWAFFYNVIGIPVAAGLLYPFFGILLSPALAGAAMAFSSVSVVLNALRLKRIKLQSNL